MNGIIESLNIEEIKDNMKKLIDLHAIIQNMLHKDYDYGIIPGTVKPTLLKPGAEKICMLFGLTPQYEFLKNVEDFPIKTGMKQTGIVLLSANANSSFANKVRSKGALLIDNGKFATISRKTEIES